MSSWMKDAFGSDSSDSEDSDDEREISVPLESSPAPVARVKRRSGQLLHQRAMRVLIVPLIVRPARSGV